ncbi:polysaccharide pyruvyl transferase family protein [Paenibacillus sp. NPDC057934]|uniref:polysaccharide pyruvyl transferase family protein n=1 Tax=Paenibacillus sp. NPDC057934 TaxID=3346282 RepID=UPI0036DA8E5A
MGILNKARLVMSKFDLLLKLNKLKNIKNNEKIIYLLSPEHGNMGDQAIAIAIRKYLQEKFIDKVILEFSYTEYILIKDNLKTILNDKDLIFLHGGGNLGNLYINEENLRRDVIKKFPKNKIIIMPQSISFTQDNNGQNELEVTKKIYSEHNNLNIVCRENKSFKTAQEIFPNNQLLLAPDSVMYLEDYYKQTLSRDGILLALRSDKEKVLDDNLVTNIKNAIDVLNENIVYRDTIINKRVNKENRIFEFNKMLDSFASSKLVITDRFHGVIFSVITKTPCIVFKSLDHKISEGIKWFANKEYIYYAEAKNENLNDIIKELLKKEIDPTSNELKNKLEKEMERIIG